MPPSSDALLVSPLNPTAAASTSWLLLRARRSGAWRWRATLGPRVASRGSDALTSAAVGRGGGGRLSVVARAEGRRVGRRVTRWLSWFVRKLRRGRAPDTEVLHEIAIEGDRVL